MDQKKDRKLKFSSHDMWIFSKNDVIGSTKMWGKWFIFDLEPFPDFSLGFLRLIFLSKVYPYTTV